jgi:tetratricopeptide (TPR) repeat protein
VWRAMDINECYSTLGLKPDTPFSEVHKRYLELSKKYHPDSHFLISESDKKYYELRFKEINAAFNAIKNYTNTGSTSLYKEEKKSKISPSEIAKAYYLKAVSFYKERDINNALDCYINAYRRDESNPNYLRGVVKCLMEKPRRLHEAKDYCLKLIKLEDYNGENFFILGKIYYKAELKNAALTNFKKAKSLNFNSDELENYLKELDKNGGFARKVLSIFSRK